MYSLLRLSNQSILKISPGCSLEELMLKLKLQYFGHLMRRVDSLEKSLMLGGIGGRRRRGPQRMRCWMASPTEWTSVWVNSGSWWWTGRPDVLRFMGWQRVGHYWATELNWMAPHSSTFARKIQVEVPGKLQYGVTRSWTWLKQLIMHDISLSKISAKLAVSMYFCNM